MPAAKPAKRGASRFVEGVGEDESAAVSGKPPMVVRYLYSPYGEAHAETGLGCRLCEVVPRRNSRRSGQGGWRAGAGQLRRRFGDRRVGRFAEAANRS